MLSASELDITIHVNRELGKGVYGTVYEATDDKTGTPLAVKVLALHDSHARETFELERVVSRMLATIKHPTLLHVYSATIEFSDDERMFGYVVMQRVAPTTLEEFVEDTPSGLRVPVIARVFSQVCAAVAELHRHNIAHCDLKLANVSYDRDSKAVCLFDFNLSVVHTPGTLLKATPRGTPLAMPYECLLGMGSDGAGFCPFKQDVYALGNMLAMLYTGAALYDYCQTLPQLRREILRHKTTMPPTPTRMTPTHRDLVRALIAFEPLSRPTMEVVMGYVTRPDFAVVPVSRQ